MGTSLVRLELLVLGMGGDPLRKRSTGPVREGRATGQNQDQGPLESAGPQARTRAGPRARTKGRGASSPGLVDVGPLAGGTSGGRLGQGPRVQDPLGPSIHGGLLGQQNRRH